MLLKTKVKSQGDGCTVKVRFLAPIRSKNRLELDSFRTSLLMKFFQILNFSFHVSVVFYCFPFKRLLLVAGPLNISLNIFPFNFKI